MAVTGPGRAVSTAVSRTPGITVPASRAFFGVDGGDEAASKTGTGGTALEAG